MNCCSAFRHPFFTFRMSARFRALWLARNRGEGGFIGSMTVAAPAEVSGLFSLCFFFVFFFLFSFFLVEKRTKQREKNKNSKVDSASTTTQTCSLRDVDWWYARMQGRSWARRQPSLSNQAFLGGWASTLGASCHWLALTSVFKVVLWSVQEQTRRAKKNPFINR